MAWYIRYGMGGGFGGCGDWEEIDAANREEAEKWAYESACEDFESYVGVQGVQSEADFAEENPDWDDEDIEEAYNNEREGWIEHEAEEFYAHPG